MPTYLPRLDLEAFSRELEVAWGRAGLTGVFPGTPVLNRLWSHYEVLRRWSSGTALIGPGTAEEAIERHYLESLAGLELLPSGAETLVDVGTGAGFPGFVLAAATPEMETVLVEPRQRKWAFLLAACRAASLPCRCLNARVADQLPSGIPARIDVLTMRALKLPSKALAALVERLTSKSRLLLWTTGEVETLPGLTVVNRLRLSGSDRRQILAFERTADSP